MAKKKQSKVAGGKSRALVLGLDLGTTSFKIAMVLVEEQLDSLNATQLVRNPHHYVTVLENFPRHLHHSLSSVPTYLFYDHENKLFKWGHEADEFQGQKNFDPEYFVANWKLALHKSTDPSSCQVREWLQSTATRLGKYGLDAFVEDFSKALFAFLFENHEESPIRKRFGAAADTFNHIDIMIAVPPGWPRHEHEILSSAFARGLGKNRSFRIFRASETECVLRSWMQESEVDAEIGETLLLLDLGGGTVCISAFRRILAEDSTLTWAHIESHSLSTGSEIVTQEFVADFKRRLSEHTNLQITPKLVHDARKKFNFRKLTIGESMSKADLHIKVPGLKLEPEKDFIRDKMYFSEARLRNYFKSSQDQILRLVQALTDRIIAEYGSAPRYCITAGAYANNRLFRDRLREANKHNMHIILLQNNSDAVARGACLTRLNGNFNQFAGGASKHSIAILTYIDSREARTLYPFPATRGFTRDGRQYSPALLWVTKKGDPMRPNHVAIEGGRDLRWRVFENEEDITFTDTLFISDSDIPKEVEYTVLEYKTATPALWRNNMSNLRKRGITGKLYDVTWDMANVKLEQKNGTVAPMRRTDIATDLTDPKRSSKRRIMHYKFILHVSSTDIQVSIQTFHTRNRQNAQIVAQKEIAMTDAGEFESAALQEEYDNVGAVAGLFADSIDSIAEPNDFAEATRASGPVSSQASSPSEEQVSSAIPTPRLEPPPLRFIAPQPTAEPAHLQRVGSSAFTNMSLDGVPQAVVPFPKYTHSPHTASNTCDLPSIEMRGQHATTTLPPQPQNPASRADSRCRTPLQLVEQLQQARMSILRESQRPAVSPSLRDAAADAAAVAARSKGKIQPSLRTPVVPAKRRIYEFDLESDGDEDEGED